MTVVEAGAAVLENTDLHEMLRRMYRVRRFDEAAIELIAAGELPGACHTSIGQEAEVVGACMALTDRDYMTGNHRSHGHPIAKGSPLRGLMAELLGRATGICGGKGGSMHLADFSRGSLGESGIVGAGLPIAVGAGLSAKLRGTDQVALSFFGDGGASTGPFHESLNLAAIWKLPVIFLCENNGYAVSTKSSDVLAVEHVATRAVSYDIPGVIVDGQDALAVFAAVTAAVARARNGDGPSLLDVKTYRYRNHGEYGGVDGHAKQPYRSEDEIEEWRRRDPIELFSAELVKSGALDASGLDEIIAEVESEVQDAVNFALESPFPELNAAYEGVFTNPIPIRR